MDIRAHIKAILHDYHLTSEQKAALIFVLNSMSKETNDIFPPPIDDFEICWPTYLSDKDPTTERRYDIVRWEACKPREVINLKTGKKEMRDRFCYTVATLWWNEKEPCFEFESCGLRWLEANPTPSVIKMILDFCKKMEQKFDQEKDQEQ